MLVLSSADGWARDKNGTFSTHNNRSCGYYLDLYSRTTLRGDRTLNGPYAAWAVFAWINGYLTAYNEHVANGKKTILGSMTLNDVRRWMAVWCRDNPSKDIDYAVSALTSKLRR